MTGAVALGLAGIDRTAPTLPAAPSVRLDLDVADTDGWLIGGPGTTPVGGAAALELRRLSARVDVGLHGGASSARILLGEGSALGADWTALLVEPPAAATGEIECSRCCPRPGR